LCLLLQETKTRTQDKMKMTGNSEIFLLINA
jgi:hypothetical protein